jgi:hypothetical protein
MWGVVKTRGSPTLLKQVQQPNILSLMTRRRPASSTWFPDNKSRNPAGALFHEESTGHYGRSKPGRSQVIHQNRLDFRVLADVLESRMQEVNGIHIIQTRTFWIECITSIEGLIGALGSFQKLLEIIIHQLTNILTHIEQQLKILNQLFIWLWQHWLKIYLPKSILCLPGVKYLGFKINQEWVQPGTDQLKAVAATRCCGGQRVLGSM